MRKIITPILLVFLSTFCMANDFHGDPLLKSEFECMAQNLYHEARGESIKGLIAVASVVLNRTQAPNFPDTICEVVYQKYQFSWVGKKHIDISKISNRIKKIAYDAVVNNSLVDNTNGALFFKTIISETTWNYNMLTKTKVIGNHVFYK